MISQEQEETEGLRDGTELEPEFHDEIEQAQGSDPQRKTFPEAHYSQVIQDTAKPLTQRDKARANNSPDQPRQQSSKRIISPQVEVTSADQQKLKELLVLFDRLSPAERSSFKPEALGMVYSYRKQLKQGSQSVPLPDLTSFLDEDSALVSGRDLAEALDFAFLELIKTYLPKEIYAFFVNQKHLFSDCLNTFGQTGSPTSAIQSIKKQCQMLVFRGRAPNSVAPSVAETN